MAKLYIKEVKDCDHCPAKLNNTSVYRGSKCYKGCALFEIAVFEKCKLEDVKK